MRHCPRSGNLSWKVCELAPQERVQNRARELFVDLPVPQIKKDVEKLGDFVQPVPSERIQQRILDQISLVLRIMEKIGVAVQPSPPERVQETTRGADFCGASDHGEKWASDLGGGFARADDGFPCASDH